MGTTESKLAPASTPKPDPFYKLKAQRVAELADPRSPSCAINRTPIQVGAEASTEQVHESLGAVCFDPRSPTPGIVRTPLKNDLKVTVTSLARRLSTFFLSDVASGRSSSVLQSNLTHEDQQDLPNPKQPLLPTQSSDLHCVPKNCPSTPVHCSTSLGYGSFCGSPFVEVELNADSTLEEGEEALLLGESPLKRELSLSLLACREGVYSPLAEERPSTPLPPSEDKPDHDHMSAQSPVTSCPPQSDVSAQETLFPVLDPAHPAEQEDIKEADPGLSGQAPSQTEKTTPETDTASKIEPCIPIKPFPRLDVCSPSQAVFKPQWLGVGFGTTGVRARGVQNRGKGTSSPRSSHKPSIDENENKVVLTKQKQRGKAPISEGRSPLQILKETNSPRKHNSQVKHKVSTPEKQRFGQIDRRALILSLNKENQ